MKKLCREHFLCCMNIGQQHFSCQQTTDRSWARLSLQSKQSRQRHWQMLRAELWLVRRGGCFRIPRRPVSEERNLEWALSRLWGDLFSHSQENKGARPQESRMPYMLISTQIRLVCILHPQMTRVMLSREARLSFRFRDGFIYLSTQHCAHC